MAITEYQRAICRLIASNRIAQGESYVAGGVALNELINSSRISRDIDLFHDTSEALLHSWEMDRELLANRGYTVDPVRMMPSFVEALIKNEADTVLMQWAQDSAFRFFPLVEDITFGLTLHPFDLATNKVLALAGRLEARDWVDVINCHRRIQNAGYLFWAACGKDPGFNPTSLIAEAKRSSHYSADEIAQLEYSDSRPNASLLGEEWHAILKEAEHIVEQLPYEHAGSCVIDGNADLYKGAPKDLDFALRKGAVHFHKGTLKGSYPKLIG
jgi:hypothetical protein